MDHRSKSKFLNFDIIDILDGMILPSQQPVLCTVDTQQHIAFLTATRWMTVAPHTVVSLGIVTCKRKGD